VLLLTHRSQRESAQHTNTQTQTRAYLYLLTNTRFARSGDLVTIQNALFHMSINGGWFSSKPVIKTANGWDPLFALMVAYLCAYEYSPSAIKKDLNSDFPSDPNGWPGWG